MTQAKGMDEILQAIPHRPPFLFLDRVVEVTESGIVAERTVRAEEPHFEGHYPGNPLMPGVLLCEACFQAAAVYLVKTQPEEGTGERTPVLARIQEAKFKQMVRPGDLLRIEVTFKETLSQFQFLKGTVRVEGKVALTVSFALAMLEGKGGA
jgi:3-hydroxyacyl-[acyl-carrier-protein] dehydratase